MIALVKYISAVVKDGIRRITVSRFGKYDTCETAEVAPYGFDATPVANTQAIFSDTTIDGVTVVFGYVNKNQKADIGESRMYSTDADGALKYNVWVRNTGEVLIGESDTPTDYTNNLVKYNQLNTAVQQDVVLFINQQLALIATGITSAGGTYTPGTMNVNITTSKADKIKTT